MTKEEFFSMVNGIKQITPSWWNIYTAKYKGKMVGATVAIPNVNEIIEKTNSDNFGIKLFKEAFYLFKDKNKKTDGERVLISGVSPDNIDDHIKAILESIMMAYFLIDSDENGYKETTASQLALKNRNVIRSMFELWETINNDNSARDIIEYVRNADASEYDENKIVNKILNSERLKEDTSIAAVYKIGL